MKLVSLYVRNFRPFSELSCEFSPGINQVIGQNGQGKTSILEAISLAMTTTSFRTAKLYDIIKHQSDGFFICVVFEKEGVRTELEISYDGQRKRLFCNKRPIEVKALIGQLVGVISYPEIQNLIKGPPALRRHYLDVQIAEVDPIYMQHLSRYKAALKHRNVLLRQKNFATIHVWEHELALSAAYIACTREKIVEALCPLVAKSYHAISGKSIPLQLTYTTTAPKGESEEGVARHYYEEYGRRRPLEAIKGSTCVGPHRDDLSVMRVSEGCNDGKSEGKSDGRLMRCFASEGEMRLAALALKFAEWQSLHERLKMPPLMLIDDFGAYLDAERRARLFAMVSELGGQVFLSMHELQGDACAGKVLQLASSSSAL